VRKGTVFVSYFVICGASYLSLKTFFTDTFVLRRPLIRLKAVQKYGSPDCAARIALSLAMYLTPLYYVWALHSKSQFRIPYPVVHRHSELKKWISDIMSVFSLGSTWFLSWLLHCPTCCMIYVKTSMPMPIEYLEIGHDFLRAKLSHF